MAYTYKCESCNSIGELEQFLPTVECPACGGEMRPMDAQGNITQPSSSLSSTNLGLVKVAKTVNLGFSGMIKSSGTGTGTGTGAFMPSKSMDSAAGRTSKPFPDNTNSSYEMPRQEFDPNKNESSRAAHSAATTGQVPEKNSLLFKNDKTGTGHSAEASPGTKQYSTTTSTFQASTRSSGFNTDTNAE